MSKDIITDFPFFSTNKPLLNNLNSFMQSRDKFKSGIFYFLSSWTPLDYDHIYKYLPCLLKMNKKSL